MKKERVKCRICYFGGFLAICLILYSCLKDESDWDLQKTSNGVIKGKNRELSLDAALSWYEANQTPVVATRSVDTKFELLSKLHWKKGLESRKEKFEVVEVPLLNRGGAVLMDSETMEKYKETELGKIRNISRMVIIKNLETGEIINFVMHIIGTYDYLMNAKHFEENSYLYRDPHFSGSVYFYEPEGSLVNGWKYEDGKIVATIKQGTEEGLQMQNKITTREYVIPVCHFESVLVEYNDCNPTLYQDPEYGLEIGVECRKKTKWENVEVCEDIYYDQDGNSHTWYPSSDGNVGGGGGYTPQQPVAPKAKKIFRNSKMTKENWEALERMLDKITENCMGSGLYNGLVNVLNGKTITIEFNSGVNGAFGDRGEGAFGITLGKQMESGNLIHELMHAYQAYQESTSSYNSSILNLEIETHFVQYLYLKRLPEYPGSKWEKRDNTNPRRKAIKKLNDYIDNKGNLLSGKTISSISTLIENKIIPSFENSGYTSSKGFIYNSSRPVLDNLKNLREITKNCN